MIFGDSVVGLADEHPRCHRDSHLEYLELELHGEKTKVLYLSIAAHDHPYHNVDATQDELYQQIHRTVGRHGPYLMIDMGTASLRQVFGLIGRYIDPIDLGSVERYQNSKLSILTVDLLPNQD